jgi:hypothetical protein
MIIDFFKKLAKSIKSMITDDKIAAAQIAQIFGSELLMVQQSVSDSRSQPDIVKLNPKQFLVGETQFRNQQRAQDQQLALALQREAEALHPLPQQFAPPVQAPVHHQAVAPPPVQTLTSHPGDPLSRIATSLERIAARLELVDIKPKRKTLKRKPKSNKTVLLNENNV